MFEFNIQGRYMFKIHLQGMFLDKEIIVKGKNLITTKGEMFFLNRCINDNFNPILYVVIGNGINPPQKNDSELGNETERVTCIKQTDPTTKEIILKTKFTAEQLVGTTEIGVGTTRVDDNEFILISHDVFEDNEITDSFVNGAIGEVELDYIFELSTSQIRTNWTKHYDSNYKNIYYIYEPNTILNVSDKEGNGYVKKYSLEEVKTTEGSYYHDVINTNNLYVHGFEDENPKENGVIIQTK